MSIKLEPVHYHPKLPCIHNAHSKKYHPSVEVMEADKKVMDDVHLISTCVTNSAYKDVPSSLFISYIVATGPELLLMPKFSTV